ncbi:uncharacterized protein LOC143260040 [Megalopta genalis]|uniref:uncharacterized protein LOC143260040 n=1 Tax=Megalopta genalis TaxID=115081 RepID=UPI003FD02517
MELEQHKVIHRPDYFFECSICQVKYKRQPSLKRYILLVHTVHDTRLVFIIKNDLIQHIKRCHNSTLQVCRFCGKKVKDVKGHEWKHEKQARQIKYQCHLCAKTVWTSI